MGRSTFREFICALSGPLAGNSKTSCAGVHMYDLDGNGFITKARDVGNRPGDLQDGGTVMKMQRTNSTPEKRTEKIFRQMDANKDGRLSLQEFIDGSQNDPSNVRCCSGHEHRW
ncbi:Neurocalcin homolog [Geodia barretti]|uniref:Neurocalcin homolog n=1 Tax=Geodia barretti TaxID=519541 RepID=A0AA35RJU6_GEOBA|nr:Neurocalcin homolog [Geodia barretti]